MTSQGWRNAHQVLICISVFFNQPTKKGIKMETRQELENMIGKQGSEELILSPILNTYFSPWHWEDLITNESKYHPRNAKKLQKNSKKILHTWTWKKQGTRLDTPGNCGFCLVRDNEEFTEQ